MRAIAYILIFIFIILPFPILAFFIDLRLFIVFPIFWYIMWFYRGIAINKKSDFLSFEIRFKNK